MSIYEQVMAALAVGGALLLLAGGVGHLRQPQHLAAVLAAQRLVPRWLHRPLSGVIATVEAGVGAAAVAGWLAGSWLPMVAVSAVYAAFGGYTAVLRVRRPGARCGCLGSGTAVSWVVVARAWVFCVGAIVAAPVLGEGAAAVDQLGVASGAVLVALIAWIVPQVAGIGAVIGDRQG